MSTTNRPATILAEEHKSTRTFLEDNLTADGYRVLTAAHRAKALALLSTGQPDLIIVDRAGARTGCTGSGCSSAAATMWSRSRLRIRSCGRASPRCCGARRRGRIVRVGSVVIDVRLREVRVAGGPVELSVTDYR